MKVKHYKDESKIKIEFLDDLLYIKSVLDRGDSVHGVSYRRIKDDTKARADSGQRVRVFLGVNVESTEFHEHSKTLRITGPLVESSDSNVTLGAYHTLEASVGDTLKIRKKWKKWQLDRLIEAEKSSETGIVLIVSIEEGEADFAVLRRFGVDYVFRVIKTIAGKEMEDEYTASAQDFYDSVTKKIVEYKAKDDLQAVIICGPGFAKDKVAERLKNKKISGFSIEAAGCGGRAGIQEILKRGVVEKIVEESRVGVETRLVEELISGVAKDSAVAYGLNEVKRASELGSVETLLITYRFLQKHNPEKLIERVKQGRGEVMVVSSDHDAGERLDAIGGVGAILRFPIS